MWNFPLLMMVAGGLGLIVIGIRGRKMWETGYGICTVGITLFGYLAKANDMYSWFQWPFMVALVALVIKNLVQKARSA